MHSKVCHNHNKLQKWTMRFNMQTTINPTNLLEYKNDTDVSHSVHTNDLLHFSMGHSNSEKISNNTEFFYDSGKCIRVDSVQNTEY